MFKTVCCFNIASTIKRKKETKKELFLKSRNYLFGGHLLKLCYILNAPLVLKFIGYVVYLSSWLLLHISFSASYRFHLFLLKVLFVLKTLQGNFGNLTTVKHILFWPRSPCFLLSEGVGKQRTWWGMWKWKWKPPCQCQDEFSPKLTPTLFASYLMPETGVLTRTYFAEGQVPDCPDVTCT